MTMGSLDEGAGSAAVLDQPTGAVEASILDGLTPLVDAAVIDLRSPEPDRRQPASPRSEAHGGRLGEVSLAVIMPVYNEEATIRQAVDDVLSVEFPCPVQLIVVNDGSTDRTAEILATLSDPRLYVVHHDSNRGKGAALRTGAGVATTTYMVPFDADLEYRAADLVPMLAAVMAGGAEVVYGSRVAGRTIPHSSKLYAIGNWVMTHMANRLYGSEITDLHTCLKLVPCEVFRTIPLLEEGFGLDTELTAWLLHSGARFVEVPISYHSRSRAEGKKIGWRDSIACFQILLLVRLQRAPA